MDGRLLQHALGSKSDTASKLCYCWHGLLFNNRFGYNNRKLRLLFDGADSRAYSSADNDAYVYLIGLLGILCKQTHPWMPPNLERNGRLRAGITTSGHSDCRLSTYADIGTLHLRHVLV